MRAHREPATRVPPEVEGYRVAVSTAYGARMRLQWSGDSHLQWSVRDQTAGPLSFAEIRNSGTIRANAAEGTGSSTNGRIVLMLVEEGELELDQGDGRQRLRHATGAPGSLLMLNFGRALEIVQPGRIRVLSLSLPTDYLAAQYRDIESRCGVAVGTEMGMASVLRDVLRSLWRERGHLETHEQKSMPAMLSNLIGSVFVRDEEQTHQRLAADACMARIRGVIEVELGNARLCPQLIAERLHVSPSYLYAMARKCGTSIGALVMDRRLDRCREVLADPAQAAHSVTEIAFAWGFQDLSHFSHRFSSRFGCSPRVFRRSVHGALQQH